MQGNCIQSNFCSLILLTGDKNIDQVNQIRDSLAVMGDNSTAFSLPQVLPFSLMYIGLLHVSVLGYHE